LTHIATKSGSLCTRMKKHHVFGTGISDSRTEPQKLSFLHREPP
jgi:hypothetical protein